LVAQVVWRKILWSKSAKFLGWQPFRGRMEPINYLGTSPAAWAAGFKEHLFS
jgi:hypothetical protein